jgi:hypothetical protein
MCTACMPHWWKRTRDMLQQDHHLRPSIAELTQHPYLDDGLAKPMSRNTSLVSQAHIGCPYNAKALLHSRTSRHLQPPVPSARTFTSVPSSWLYAPSAFQTPLLLLTGLLAGKGSGARSQSTGRGASGTASHATREAAGSATRVARAN